MSRILKTKVDSIFHLIMILVVLFDAVVPTTAQAMPPGFEEKTSIQPGAPENNLPVFTGAESRAFASKIVKSDAPPVQTAQSTSTPEPTPTPAFIPTSPVPPTANKLPTQIPALAGISDQVPLQFDLSASPDQASPGDEVVFTVTITNNGKTEITGLVFSNILPPQLKSPASENDDLKFDSETNTLKWAAVSKEGNGGALMPGETITLQYIATIDPQIEKDIQLVDEADLFVDGAVLPITAALKLGIFPQGRKKEFTLLGPQGGKAEGLNGHVYVNIPDGELNVSEGILIEDLNEDPQPDQPPFIVFQLDVASQEQESAISINATETSPAATATVEALPTATPPDTATETSPTATATVESLSATTPSETVAPALSTPTVESLATTEVVETPEEQAAAIIESVSSGSNEESPLESISETPADVVYESPTPIMTATPTVELSPTILFTPTIESTPTITITPTAGPSPTIASSETTSSILAAQEQDTIGPLNLEESVFDKPVEITVSFDGLADLSGLGAEYSPYLVTLDEKSDTWVNIPLKSIDRDNNTITAETTHFSIWGAGVGFTKGVTSFDNPYPTLFTGSSRYSVPIWTPPGRNGMTPSVSLSYSSATADGVLGDIQAPWVGMGWNVDSIEIARKITSGACGTGCGSGSYGYENKFLLLFNGTGYELIPDGTTAGRYHTKSETFLYIQLHSNGLGNNSPAAQNLTSEWWEVVQKDGLRWRLGWSTDSEQLAAMKGYPGAATGTWAVLGYAGGATDVVTSRWRVDQGTDTHGNRMTFTYFEEDRLVAGTSVNYNRASYLDTIAYTSHTSGTPAAGYSVVFVRESRGAGLSNEVPTSFNDWDNWDTYRLDRIDVKYGTSVVRTYDLGYTIRSYTDASPAVSWYTTVLTSVAVSGSGSNAPTTLFTYVDKDNRAANGGSSNEWDYPRLASVSNGWESTNTYTYANDGRAYTSWYNWRVETLDVTDGVNASPMKTTFSYSTPCYNDSTAGWCNGTNVGELIGYAQTTAVTKDFDGATSLAIAVHKFHTDQQKAGREYETQNQNGSGTVLSQANVTYTVSTTGMPATGFFTYASRVDESLNGNVISRTDYEYDITTGNLTRVKEFTGTATLYRQADYAYVTNTSASVWILDTLARLTLKNASLTTLAVQEYGYDGSLAGSGSPTLGELTLSRIVNGTQTIDAKYVYDTYGNVTETRLYKSYGSTSSQPSSAYLSYLTAYDTALKTHVISSDPPLIPATLIDYNYGLGSPTIVTDPNGNTTTTAYDGLGRVTSITYPGYAQANIKYTYPTPSGSPLAVTAPYAVKFEVWDQPASLYRSAWQMLDGLGRVIQTQSPYETAGNLVLTDTSYNAQGLSYYQGLPRTLSGTGGAHFAPTWGSVPHTTNSYDALGRVTLVAYADSSSETYSYSGLRTTAIDRNNHQKVREMDAFGRLVKAEEYTGTGTYALYATTTYEYDPRDLLKKVTDAAGNQTTIGYNGFGQKTSMTDPDMGAWSYGYDVLGNLNSQTDARGCGITVLYDDLNRPTQKLYTGPGACDTTPDVTYTYDSITGGNEGLGRRTGMTDGSGSTSWIYNILGQVTNQSQTIDGANYQSNATFDALGRPLTQTLPSAEVLNYSYNAMGALSGLSGTNTYVSQIHYAASGQVNDQTLGNGLLQQSCYSANTLRLTDFRVYSGSLQTCGTNPSSPKLKLSYTYQGNGNVSQIVDATRSETLNYTYDELDRLSNVSGPYTTGYTYNSIGNTASRSLTPGFSVVAAGYYHTCALGLNGGGIKCWGRNYDAQLGDNTSTQRLTPVDVSGLTSGVTAVSTGRVHTCALTTGGGAKCWGYNGAGRLGDGTTTNRKTPVDVSGLTSGVTAIAAGYYHTCALTTSGGVKCWGYNAYGQLGDGTTTDRTTPVDVSGLTSGVTAIAAGGNHTCALTTSGGVKCWGANYYGQLGDGTYTNRTTPVNVSGLTSGAAAVSAGEDHTCSLTTTGGVKCWGSNYSGQIGDGTTTDRAAPVDVSGLTSGAAAITTGDSHTCARTTGSGMKCWGDNAYGQLGDGTTTNRTAPVNVSGLTSGVTSIAAGGGHSCALSGGVPKCWGLNDNGQLGDGTLVNANTPVNTLFPATTYTYGSSAHKHAATALSSGETYAYDANGNMTTRVEGGQTYTQTFDAENRLISVTVNSQTTQFLYNGDGTLVKKTKPDGSKTIYAAGGVYEVDKTSAGSVTRTITYYPVAGAMRINGTMYYILKDHLGSASVVTDASGTIVGEQRYYPFGETRLTTGSIFTDQLFTGQREMAGLGIYHFNARFYSPRLGRFLSADTIVPGYANPQAFNRYSYVLNNPLRYIDPTGHWNDEGCGTGGGGGGTGCNLPSSPSQQPSPGREDDEDNDGSDEITITISREDLIEIADSADSLADTYHTYGNWWGYGAGTAVSVVMLFIDVPTCFGTVGTACGPAIVLTIAVVPYVTLIAGEFGGNIQASTYEDVGDYLDDVLINNNDNQFTINISEEVGSPAIMLPGGIGIGPPSTEYEISINGTSTQVLDAAGSNAINSLFGVAP